MWLDYFIVFSSQFFRPSISNRRSARKTASSSGGRSGWNLLNRPRGSVRIIAIIRSAEKKSDCLIVSNALNKSLFCKGTCSGDFTCSVKLSPFTSHPRIRARARPSKMLILSPAKVNNSHSRPVCCMGRVADSRVSHQRNRAAFKRP